MLFILCALMFAADREIQIPDPIYQISDCKIDGEYIYLLDQTSTAILKMDHAGKVHAQHKAKGQGPGEFSIPRCIAVTEDKVFVGDLRKMHVFDKNFQFLDAYSLTNNPQDIEYHQGKLYLSITSFPVGEHAVRVYDMDNNFLTTMYEHGLGSEVNINMPFIAKGPGEKLMVQARLGFALDQINYNGKAQQRLPLTQPVGYKELIPLEPFKKKYGYTRPAFLHWRSKWSEPAGLAIVNQQYALLCFKNLQQDLRTYRYFVHVFDLKANKSIKPWVEVPGPLLMGGEVAWFHTEKETGDGDYLIILKGLSMEALLK